MLTKKRASHARYTAITTSIQKRTTTRQKQQGSLLYAIKEGEAMMNMGELIRMIFEHTILAKG